MTKLSGVALIGDIGGTNARLALCNLADGTLSTPIIYSAVENPSLEEVILRFKKDCGQEFSVGCIAIACPITGDHVKMTNNPWEFSIRELKEHTGLEKLLVINDFTAMSMSVPVLDEKDLVKVGGGERDRRAPVAIYGAGTGLGVGHLVHVGDKWLALPGEGGHVDMAPANSEEDEILLTLRKRFGHVSYERVLSGPGLVNIYEAISGAHGRTKSGMTPADVTGNAVSANPDPDCARTLKIFCSMMGSFGGNLALTMGTYGGVFIAGGVVPHFLDYFLKSDFRRSFEDKGRFNGLLAKVPVYVVTDKLAGLRGSGAAIRQEMGAVL
ncbi:MAG: glucokinase [Succinivibrio sp.]|jgi:glucokinase|nr:glucokinase [Succinivibrio sp.]